MSVRTTTNLSDALDAELSWRKKELRYLAMRINSAESDAQLSYLRAAIALLYAHWEGFVVAALRSYIEYVSSRKVPFEKLRPELRVAVLRSCFSQLENAPGAAARVRLVREYQRNIGANQKMSADQAIRAESNLNSERFLGLMALAGLDESKFSGASIFLDESLLKRRNGVCHGERLTIDAKGYLSTESQVVALIEQVKNEILNAAVLKTYQLSSA